jgi:hypothetical protein
MKKYIFLFIILLLKVNNINAYNSEYFLIKEYDEFNNKTIVYSYLTKKKYLLNLEYTHKNYRNINIS